MLFTWRLKTNKRRFYFKICLLITILIFCLKVLQEHPCFYWAFLLFGYPKYDGNPLIPPNITIVSAFFNIGKFRKGAQDVYFTPKLYTDWASVFKNLENPFVFYTDSDNFADLVSAIRRNRQNKTKIIKIDRKDIWAFDYIQKIKTIYSDPKYPKHHPNTVIPEYTCVQNAKYSCIEKALVNDYFKTKYFMWLDIGYFRVLTRDRNFRLELPSGFNSSKIAMNQVRVSQSLNLSAREIFRNNLVWLGGGLSLGKKEIFAKFIQDYRKALEHYLAVGLSNTDQQILFSMYTTKEREMLKPSVEIQPYSWHLWGECWFYLGYQCYREL